ncbi:MAG: hypothetical protein IJD22_07475, partial [Clostridia bacterium]|nr:hypothetical protein [Clostridia bacterium]
DAADLFETNASSVILDIDGGRLSVPEGTHAAEVYSYGKNYYFDSDYLRQLDDRINFLAAAGINSYLRIYSDLEGHTFDYSPDRKESLSLMCAIAGFLAERYPSVKGYIIGSAANTNVSSLTAEYAESRARLFSVFCESVRSRNPYAQVIIPYSEVGTCDPHLTAAMTDYYLSKYSAGTQSFMLETAKGATSAIASASRLSDTATSVGFSSGGASMIWIAPGEYGADRITEAYRELCMQSAAHGFIFCAVSVEKTDKSPILYEALKQMLDRENVISASSSQFTASDSANGFSGVYSLWDFTSSYDTKGWVSGGSFAPPITAKGENGERVLRADNSDISKSAGILICRTEAPLDMTGVSARFTLSVESDTANFAEIALILGSGESRAEFSATVECNKKTSLTCDLQDFEGARSIDYAAIIVRGGEGASATVSHVELCSKELTDEEMSLRFSSERPSPHNPLLYAVIIFTAAGTVTVFSVLIKKQTSHKKKEENNEK